LSYASQDAHAHHDADDLPAWIGSGAHWRRSERSLCASASGEEPGQPVARISNG
jgi:hypothetical protein